MACSFLAGVALLITGGVYLGQITPNARSNQIAAYNSAVAAWGVAAPAFIARGPFSVTVEGTVVTNLSTLASLDEATIETGAGISVFGPSSRAAFSTTLSPFQTLAVPSGSNLVWHTVIVKDGSGSTVAAVPINFAFVNTVGTSSSSSSSHSSSCAFGSKSGGYCYVYFMPAGGLCLTLDQSGGSWGVVGGCTMVTLDTANAMYFARVNGIAQSPGNSVAPPRDTLVTYTYSGSAAGSFLWAGVPVTIRSNMDPYAVAVAQTQGYMTFGGREALIYTRGVIFLGVGAGLTAPFVLLALFFVAHALRVSRSCSGCGCGGGLRSPSAAPDATGARLTFRAAFSAHVSRSLDAAARPLEPVFRLAGTTMRRVTTRWGRSKAPATPFTQPPPPDELYASASCGDSETAKAGFRAAPPPAVATVALGGGSGFDADPDPAAVTPAAIAVAIRRLDASGAAASGSSDAAVSTALDRLRAAAPYAGSPPSSEGAAQALASLRTLGQAGALRVAVDCGGAVAAIVAALRVYAADADVVCEAAGLIASVAAAAPQAASSPLVASFAIAALVAAQQSHPADSDVASEVADALAAVVAAAGADVGRSAVQQGVAALTDAQARLAAPDSHAGRHVGSALAALAASLDADAIGTSV